MLKKRLLAHILLVQQKFLWIVVRPVNDELEVARLSTNFLCQFAQDRFDFLDFTVTRPPGGNEYVGHCFYFADGGEAPKASDNRFAASPRSRALFCNAWIDRRHTGPEMPMAPTTWPLKSYTGMAAQRTSLLNSPSSKAMPVRRTS